MTYSVEDFLKIEFLKLAPPYYACLGILIYAVAFILKGRKMEELKLNSLIFVIIDSIGIIAGINVARISFSPTTCGQTPIEQIYIFIGGFAVVYVSVSDFWSKYKEI